MREKEKKGQDRIEKTPQEMLVEARDGLIKCRELFILSTIMLMHGLTTKGELVIWGNIWFRASLEEKRITEELVAPAKLKTGRFRTVPEVEENVRKSGAKFIHKVFRSIGSDATLDLARAIVGPHIEYTKEIQAEMGVPEDPSYNPLCVKKPTAREHTIFSGYGPTTKPLRERVIC